MTTDGAPNPHAFAKGAIAALALILPTLAVPALAQSATSAPVSCMSVGDTGELRSRVGPADAAIVEIFAGAGSTDIVSHDLTAEEWAAVDRALARLPRLHRDILRKHLRRLSFLDLQPGGGSALTSRAGPDDSAMMFDITLRASLLGEQLSTFLNTKEGRLFADDGSGFTVAFDAGDSDALTYILLHEATHIVDQVLGLTGDAAGPFRAGIWDGLRDLGEPYASSLAAQTPFRRMPPIPLRYAPAHYEALRRGPFVSFYATAAAPEDLAELVAWQQLASRYDQPLALTVRDAAGDAVFRYEPLRSPSLQARFAEVEQLLDRYERECGNTAA